MIGLQSGGIALLGVGVSGTGGSDGTSSGSKVGGSYVV